MYLQSLQISEMRCFKSATAQLQYPGRPSLTPIECPNINLLIGNNGMGKTATLMAIALATLSPVIEAAGYVPYSIVRRDRRKAIPQTEIRGKLLLHPQDLQQTEAQPDGPTDVFTRVQRIRTTERIQGMDPNVSLWENMFDDRSPAFVLVGYGASRTVQSAETVDLVGRSKARGLRYERVASLFEDHIRLMPLGVWLPGVADDNPTRWKEIVALVEKLLPKGIHFRGEFDGSEYIFSHRGLKVPFRALSDGYRAYLGWVCDLLYHISQSTPPDAELVDVRGMVLIDEVDLHLHPEWQLSVLPTLSQALPNLQFICTTHSPIVAGTVHSANTLLVIPDGSQASALARPISEIYGLNADQILVSPHFGLTSTRAPGFVNEMKQVSKQARGGDTEAALRYARMVSHGAGAEQIEELPRKRPDWIEEAARKRAARGAGADDDA